MTYDSRETDNYMSKNWEDLNLDRLGKKREKAEGEEKGRSIGL